MCNLSFTISLSWSVQGWNRLGHPLVSQTPPTPQTQFLYSPRPLVTDLYNEKKRGLPQTKQMFTFLYSTVQYTHHSSSAREKGRELKVRSQWDSYGTKEKVATKRNKYSPSLATKHKISCRVHQSSPSCKARNRSTHSLLVESTSLQVCSSGQYSAIKGKKYLNSTTHTHTFSILLFLVLFTQGDPHILL